MADGRDAAYPGPRRRGTDGRLMAGMPRIPAQTEGRSGLAPRGVAYARAMDRGGFEPILVGVALAVLT
ncbi:MAG: hypothetical protein JWP17_3982, partial [Solirubrobacterales bacterium]|nr:hypothetical protein [Solirubrobacterales bacterium]